MLPFPNLDDQTFQDIMNDALKLIPRFAPGWTDFNPHDPGITFLELFAWLTEMQQFYMDQVREDSYRKFLKLLGIVPAEAVPAKAQVTFSLRPPGLIKGEAEDPVAAETASEQPVVIPKGTKLLAGEIAFQTGESLYFTQAELTKIITAAAGDFIDNTEINQHSGLNYYAFGVQAERGSKLYLGFNRPFSQAALYISLFETDYPPVGIHGDEPAEIVSPAQLAWEYFGAVPEKQKIRKNEAAWLPLTPLRDDTQNLTRSGQISFKAPGDMRPLALHPVKETLYWLCCSVKTAGYELPPRIESLRLNTVEAIQIETITENDGWLVGSSTGLPGQNFFLPHTPVITPPLILEIGKSNPHSPLELIWESWQRVVDFDSSKPADCHYLLDPVTGELSFGDGVNGAIPPTAQYPDQPNIRVKMYQTGGGELGNVKAGAISLIVSEQDSPLRGLQVVNYRAAEGGKDPESLEQAKSRVCRELNTVSRAVTLADYEKLACQTPGLRVSRAKAILDQDNQTVTVIAVPFSLAPKPVPSEGFLDTVRHHLNRHRLVTTNLTVVPPEYVRVDIQAALGIKPGFNPEMTRELAAARLEEFLHPFRGGPEGTGWPFGRPVYPSELHQVLESLEGIDYVQQLTISGSAAEKGFLEVKIRQLVFPGNLQIAIISSGSRYL